MKTDVLTQNSKKRAEARACFLCGKIFLIASILFASQISHAQIGTWTALKNLEPNENMGVMLLLTDGTVVAHDSLGGSQALGTGWDKLTPDAKGSYVNGTWTTLASMNQERYVFASQVLPNGELFVAGGEYGEGDTAGEVYDPVANIWKRTEGVVSKMNIYDGNSEILPNGAILVGLQAGNNPSFDCQYYTPSTNKWTTAPTAPLNHDEAAWLKLPDSSILFVGIFSLQSCRFRPQTNTWIADATLPDSIFDINGEESGSATMLPNGKAIFFGATGHNCIYTPSGTVASGSWIRAADFPFISGSETGMVDAPSATMVNGHILMTVSPIGTSGNNEFLTPTYFVEYDYLSNTFTQVTSILPGIGADSIADIVCQQATLLNLPDGTILMGINQDGALSKQYFIYTPGSGPIAEGKPTINNIISDGCSFYKITGKLFNGISEGAGYGDDWQNSTNYPLVRLTDASGNIYYCKTTNWNRIGAVQTDSLEDTAYFALSPTIPGGTYSLVVTVNGFASNPTLFTTLGVAITSQTNISCNGDNNGSAVALASGTAPYTYLWSPGGETNASISNLSAGTYTITITSNGANCVSTYAIITQPAILTATATSIGDNGTNNGVASVIGSGGTEPYTYLWEPGSKTTTSITGLSAGTYTCTITDHNGCTHTTSVVVKNTTGIEEISNSSSISIYPSPNTGSFTVAGVTQGQVIQLYSVLGQLLNSVKANNTTIYFNISNHTNGIYLIRILNTDGRLITEKKIIKAQ